MTLWWGYIVTHKEWATKETVHPLNENIDKETEMTELKQTETGTEEYKTRTRNFTAELAKQKKSQQRQSLQN